MNLEKLLKTEITNNARYDQIKASFESSVGKRIRIESDARFLRKNEARCREKYIGEIVGVYDKFFVVKRPSGVETTFMYSDVLTASKKAVPDVFEIL